MNKYLQETDFFNFSDPDIQRLAEKVTGDSPRALAISIYYLVRDSIRYNPYIIKNGIEGFKASHCLKQNQAYCIPKAALMVALCRKFNIPARIGLADVRNHLSSKKFIALIGTDYFAMHGYAEVWLDDRWLKTTPVFNNELCEKFNVEPLEWDGQSDAILQEYTRDGHKHMEYLVDHGSFVDVPASFIVEGFKKHYPKLLASGLDPINGESLEHDIERAKQKQKCQN